MDFRARRDETQWSDNLPEDIFFTIFLKLPFKTILTSKSVCKSWYAHLTSPEFVKAHLKPAQESHYTTHHKQLFLRNMQFPHPPRPVAEAFDYKTLSPIKMSFPFPNQCAEAELLASCDGLVLLSIGDQSNYYLWNPSTSACLSIPGFPLIEQALRLYGLAFDPTTDAYKVVRASRLSSSPFSGWRKYSGAPSTPDDPCLIYDRTNAKVYDCKSGAWKRIEGFSHKVLDNIQAVVVNGLPHWMVASDRKMKYVPIYFDLSDEKFKELPTPDWVTERKRPLIGNIDGCLCMFRRVEMNTAQIWMLKEQHDHHVVKEAWSLVFCFQCEGFIRAFCRTLNGEMAIQRETSEMKKNAFEIYDPETKTARGTKVMFGKKNGFQMIECVESLVSPRGWYGNM